MKNSVCIFLFLLALPFIIAAQNHPVLLFKVRPTSLIDFQTPVAHIGLELRTASRFGLEVGYGIPLHGFRLNKSQDVYVDHHYGKYRAELRYELLKARHLPMFLALEAFYLPRRYQKVDDYYYNGLDEQINFTKAQVQRNVMVACFKAVRVLQINSRWSVEIFSGFGIRFRTVYYSNVELRPPNPLGDLGTTGEGELFKSDIREGRQRLPHLTYGVQVAWAINGPVTTNTF